jgi:X-X-X-Leu-X-X-Gly heptad repeat protein
MDRLKRKRNSVAGVVTAVVAALVATLCAVPLFASSNTGHSLVAAESSAAVGTIAAREEVIYATLSADGEVEAVYAVTALEVSQPGSIVDYGKFSAVKNLSTTTVLTHSDEQVSIHAHAGRFYYRGDISDLRLPWDISIQYYVAGQRVSPTELAGRDGAVTIEISTAPGSAAGTEYYNNYVLQISLTLDTRHFSNILAPGGTVANAGRNKVVTYTIMPGNAGHTSVSADATAFVLAPIEIAALPLSMKIDAPDTSALTDEFAALTDGVASLHQGMGRLSGAVSQLRQGAAMLSTGSGQFEKGLQQLDAISPELVAGSTQIMHALATMAEALNGNPGALDFGNLAQLPPALAQMGQGLGEASAGLKELKQAFELSYQSLDAAIATIPADEISQAQISSLYASNPQSTALLDSLVGYYTAGRVVKGTYQSVQPGLAAIGLSFAPLISSIDTIAGSLAAMSAQIGGSMQSDNSAPMLEELLQGVSTLAEQYEGFHAGLSFYTQGLAGLKDAYLPLNEGLAGLAQGSKDLEGGARQIHVATGELSDGVKEIPDRMHREIEQLVKQFDKSDFVPGSFLSPRNELTTAVQFVLRTQAIEKTASPVEPEPQPTPLTFWDRLISLFRPQS